MTNKEFSAWAMKAWEAEVLRNLPATKARHARQAAQRESTKAMARARRSLLAQQASAKRKLNMRLAEIEQEFRGRRETSDRLVEERRWEIIMGKK